MGERIYYFNFTLIFLISLPLIYYISQRGGNSMIILFSVWKFKKNCLLQEKVGEGGVLNAYWLYTVNYTTVNCLFSLRVLSKSKSSQELSLPLWRSRLFTVTSILLNCRISHFTLPPPTHTHKISICKWSYRR